MNAEDVDSPVPPASDATEELPAPRPWVRLAEVGVAVAVVLLGVLILLESRDIPLPRALTVVGPRTIPVIVGVGLLVLGIWYAIDVLMGDVAAPSGDSEDADPTLPADWGVLAQLAVVLVIYATLIRPIGFILASSLLFLGTAFALGSRQIARDAAIGLAVSVVAYLIFSEWLGIRLPGGFLRDAL